MLPTVSTMVQKIILNIEHQDYLTFSSERVFPENVSIKHTEEYKKNAVWYGENVCHLLLSDFWSSTYLKFNNHEN